MTLCLYLENNQETGFTLVEGEYWKKQTKEAKINRILEEAKKYGLKVISYKQI